VGLEYFWWGGIWIFPTMFLVVLITALCLIFRRGGFRFPCFDDRQGGPGRETESALDILKKRYAKGEITKEEFEQMKRDVLS
jgi:putative membrane protein